MAVLHIRPLNRTAEPEVERSQRPVLRLVTGRSRWPAVFGSSLIVFVIAAMLGAAIFHTQLAERQLEIDNLEREVRAERERFDELRLERAVLRSPERIATEATALGMVPGQTTTFIAVDPYELAKQYAAAGPGDDHGDRIVESIDPLDQFSDVKSVSVDLP